MMGGACMNRSRILDFRRCYVLAAASPRFYPRTCRALKLKGATEANGFIRVLMEKKPRPGLDSWSKALDQFRGAAYCLIGGGPAYGFWCCFAAGACSRFAAVKLTGSSKARGAALNIASAGAGKGPLGFWWCSWAALLLLGGLCLGSSIATNGTLPSCRPGARCRARSPAVWKGRRGRRRGPCGRMLARHCRRAQGRP